MNPRAGGPCQGIRNLAPHVREHGNSVEVVCLDDPQSEYLNKDEIVTIHTLGEGRGPWHYHSALHPWLAKNLTRFDAVILNGLWQYPGYVLSRLAQKPNMPPYYIFPHGMLDPWFQRAPERRLKSIRNWLYWKLIEHRVISNAAGIFFTCEEEMRLAQKTFRPYRPKQQIVVGYGVDEPPSSSERLRAAFHEKCPEISGRPYYLFLSRIHPKKGVDLLLKAFAKTFEQVGNRAKNSSEKLSSRCLVIAGPGLDSNYGREMQALANRICPPNSVYWPGMLGGEAKWGALHNAEAFVLTSHQENFGIAVAEALSCGTPVLISNQINIWREIETDNAGRVCDDTLAGAERLLAHWERLSTDDILAMKQAARRCFQNRFAIAQAAKNLVQVARTSTLLFQTASQTIPLTSSIVEP